MSFTLIKGSNLPKVTSANSIDYVILIQADGTKAITVENLATSIGALTTLTPAEIKAKLESLTGDSRLSVDAVKGAPSVKSYSLSNGGSQALGSEFRLMSVLVLSSTTQNISLGTAAAGTQLINDQEVTADTAYILEDGKYYDSSTTIHLTSTGDVTLIVVIEKA